MTRLLSRLLLGAAIACVPLVSSMPAAAAPAPVKTGFESLALPDGFRKNGGFLNRLAAKTAMEMTAKEVGASLGSNFELWRHAPDDGGPTSFVDVRAAVERQGWSVTQPAPDEKWFWIEKGAARLMLYYEAGKDGSWVYLCEAKAVPSTATDRTPRTLAVSPRDEEQAIAGGEFAGPRLPTGNTPDLYPGSPGWLPSGRGVPYPAPALVGGRPLGLWYYTQLRPNGKLAAVPVVFLPDGTFASNPRPGAGDLVDIAGQRALPGVTGVGTFAVNGGQISQSRDGFNSSDAFSSGRDGDGPWFNTGARRYRPLTPLSARELVGTWKSAGTQYLFRGDGTYESGHVDANSVYSMAVGGRGRWQLDGYLVAIRPDGAPSWINSIGAAAPGFMVMGSSLYGRK